MSLLAPARTEAVAHVHVADLDQFAADVAHHLRRAWTSGATLHVTVENRVTMVIESVVDLEMAHEMLRGKRR